MRRKGIEALKSALIILLILVALVMIVQISLTGAGIQLSWQDIIHSFFGGKEESADTELSALHAARPVQAAVMGENGIYAANCGFEELDRIYDSVSQIFSEAIGSAKEPSAVSEEEWLSALEEQGVYLVFDMPLPISALADWLLAESDLDFAADSFVLTARSGEEVELWYAGSFEYYRCSTSASSDMLLDRTAQFRPNGAKFAFQLVDTWDVYNNVDPASIVPHSMSAAIYSAENSLDSQAVNALMESLLINPFTESGYTDQNGSSVYLCADGTLKISPDGTASYELNSSDSLDEMFAASESGVLDLGGTIEKTRQFTEKTAAARCGSARVYLSSIEPTENGYIFTYSYYIDAMKAAAVSEGYAARFEFEGDSIVSLELCYRQFAATQMQQELMQPLYAAATYPALRRARLAAAYTEGEDGLLTAWWHIG